jgi:ABC-type transport system involved in multi-copper enzyme maturation permease subunit
MGRILAIARNTFRENIRDKVLYNLILFALIMILSSIALGQLTLGHETKVIIDLGLSVMSMFGTIIAIFIGISLVYKEIERRTVYALLAKPVYRWEFIAGKYLGLLTTLLVNVLTMTTFLAATLLYHGGVNASEMLHLLPAVYLIFLSLALTTSMALVFSTFSTPALSALFTLFLWGIGHFSNDLLDLGKLAGSAVLEKVTRVLYYLLPNLANFTAIDSRNIIQSAAYYQPVSAASITWVTAYGVIYSSVLVAIAAAVFARKEFK